MCQIRSLKERKRGIFISRMGENKTEIDFVLTSVDKCCLCKM